MSECSEPVPVENLIRLVREAESRRVTVESRKGKTDNDLPTVGRPKNTCIALEHADSQQSLDARNAPRDRGLIDAKLPRRASNTASVFSYAAAATAAWYSSRSLKYGPFEIPTRPATQAEIEAGTTR
jgi:hypothetical protein